MLALLLRKLPGFDISFSENRQEEKGEEGGEGGGPVEQTGAIAQFFVGILKCNAKLGAVDFLYKKQFRIPSYYSICPCRKIFPERLAALASVQVANALGQPAL